MVFMDTQSLPGYVPDADAYDELFTAQGEPRPHWQYLFSALQALGPQELAERHQELRQLLRENGVTYNTYDGSDKAARPWQLDPIPNVIASQEWLGIERGLSQRAELLNLLLYDIYGPGEVFRKGLLPPELIYSHPGFLRACTSIKAPGKAALHLYAAELARKPDGSMVVFSDRTQAPPGAGYVLENRVLMSRIFPSVFHDAQVHRLAGFFRILRQTLLNAAREARDNTRIVVLSPGPDSETYFEQAYLAKYLGYTLVQGSDLTVRDGRVWIKTLNGLQPVDVILRWLDGEACDPLDLRGDSFSGVAGLVQSVRLSQVAVINPTGTGVLENRGLIQYLPALCRHFLNEDLILTSPDTLWCGDRKARQYIFDNLQRYSIKSTVTSSRQPGFCPTTMSEAEKAQLRENIQAQPYHFVAQEIVSCSTLPVFTGSALEPRQMVLRTFAVMSNDGYYVMPGGLTRAGTEKDGRITPWYSGGITKDTWVLGSEPVQQVSLLPQTGGHTILQSGRGEIPSRVAENLFWLGRYAERGENLSRLLRAVLLHVIDPPETGSDDKAYQHSLLQAVTRLSETYPGFIGEGAEARLAEPEEEVLSVYLDRERIGSLAYNLSALIYAARTVRDRLSPDVWRVFNAIETSLQDLQSSHKRSLQAGIDHSDLMSDALEDLNDLVDAFAAFSGFCVENMTHGQGWSFLIIGRRLERAQLTAHLLHGVLQQEVGQEAILLETLLNICDSLMTYRSRYRTQVHIESVLDLLLQDESNPRSLSYQLERLQHFISQLPRDSVFAYKSQEERLVLQALTEVRLADPRELMVANKDTGTREQLDTLLNNLSALLPHISDAISNSYFSHAEQPRQLTARF
jgi:uncharacterized circularly permuted ATP-grasp superfamily protein/uncharacterized alpha-E superfamily protein